MTFRTDFTKRVERLILTSVSKKWVYFSLFMTPIVVALIWNGKVDGTTTISAWMVLFGAIVEINRREKKPEGTT